jgi:hypothetical protein
VGCGCAFCKLVPVLRLLPLFEPLDACRGESQAEEHDVAAACGVNA